MNYEDRVTKQYIENALGSCAKIAAGTYTGTGTYGVDNPNSLTFDFEPKLVIILVPPRSYNIRTNLLAIWTRGQAYGSKDFYESASYSGCLSLTLRWSGNSVSWYAEGNASASDQLNAEGTTYYYAVIG